MMIRIRDIIKLIRLLPLTLFFACNEADNSSVHYNSDFKLINEVLSFADLQLKYACHCADSARALNDKLVTPCAIDHKTGHLLMGSPYDWRSGFFAGNLWQMYEYTHDSYWLEKAKQQTWMIKDAATYSKDDMGFMINNSFGKAYSITGDVQYLEILITAAKTLAQRFDWRVGCIQSWDSTESWPYAVIVDDLLNLEIFFDVSKITGDSTYYNMAVSHADKTMKNHFRPNYSSYQVVDYDVESGDVVKKGTCQGYSDESYWSRGQAWGLYGYTMCYRYTHDEKYLDFAKNIANFLMNLDYADDLIPYWDMLCPEIPNTVRDASAATIIASGMLELCNYSTSVEKELYYDFAIRILNNLHKYYESEIYKNYGFLLLHSTQYYNADLGIDVPLVYADYYYLEAIMRLRNINKLGKGK